ncbi:hypothetical protein F4777DRAFT_493358 [Nemania sp. FL0916]|nr:hypothetical protein F4777DRAFT_493358 [Nemania sp. FL0916]
MDFLRKSRRSRSSWPAVGSALLRIPFEVRRYPCQEEERGDEDTPRTQLGLVSILSSVLNSVISCRQPFHITYLSTAVGWLTERGWLKSWLLVADDIYSVFLRAYPAFVGVHISILILTIVLVRSILSLAVINDLLVLLRTKDSTYYENNGLLRNPAELVRVRRSNCVVP